MDNNTDYKEKRHYKGKQRSDIVNYPLAFRRAFLSPTENSEVLNMPVYSHRIILKILNDISNDQFNPNNPNQIGQLSLFDKDLMTEDNSFVRFTFNVTDISEHRDYKDIKRALDFLENYKKKWHKSKNSEGKTVSTLGGLVSVPVVSDGKVSFLVSNFWFEKLVKLSSYNVAYLNTAWNLSNSKQILFYLWILEIPETGTRINFDMFQNTYDYNYKNPSALAKNFLKNLKYKLDRYSNKSFNYSVKGDYIHIKPYFTKNINLDLSDDTVSNQEIRRKISYWKERHNLSESNINIIKSLVKLNKGDFKLLVHSYNSFVKHCRDEKKKATDFVDNSFMSIFQKHIIETYQNSVFGDIVENGYPTII